MTDINIIYFINKFLAKTRTWKIWYSNLQLYIYLTNHAINNYFLGVNNYWF